MAHRRVEHVMGTVIGFDVRDASLPDGLLDRVVEHLRSIDARFSTYRADSEVSALARGDLDEASCSPDLRHVLAACDHLTVTSGGAFDARRQAAAGGLDPSAYVKGWAVEEAAWILDEAGVRDYVINAGGDIVARGTSAPGRPWRVGVRHPDRTDRLAAVLEVTDRAVATSGTYERGDHIVDPRTGEPATALRSLTVVGPRLAFADAYATAGFAMGIEGIAWVARHPGHDALAITSDDRMLSTAGFDAYRASAA